MILRLSLLLFGLCLGSVPAVHAAAIQRRDLSSSPPPPTDGTSRTWPQRLWNGISSVRAGSRSEAVKKPHHLSKYFGDIVLRFPTASDSEALALSEAINTLYLDVWSITKNYTDIRLPQAAPGIKFITSNRTVRQVPSVLRVQKRADLFFQDYQPLSAIAPWMKLMEALFPAHVELLKIGTTFEGRTIEALKVGKKNFDGRTKPTVLVIGASHAREWISVSSVNFMAYSLITGYEQSDKGVDSMIDELDWIFIPTLNMDGYVYTWEHDRLWRKNRQPTALSFCKGIDLDRAFDFHFDNSPQTKSNPCSDMFPGGFPFQAKEAQALVDWAHNYTSDGTEFVGLLDIHSYSQQILYPYSYSCRDKPPDLENLRELGIGLAKAIRLQTGEHYDVAAACDGTGVQTFPGATGSGSLLDYFYERYDVRYSFQIKLRDTGTHGFLLPKSNIVPTGEESFSLLKYFAQFILDDGSPTMSDEL